MTEEDPKVKQNKRTTASDAEFARRVAMATLEADHQTLELEARIDGTRGSST